MVFLFLGQALSSGIQDDCSRQSDHNGTHSAASFVRRISGYTITSANDCLRRSDDTDVPEDQAQPFANPFADPTPRHAVAEAYERRGPRDVTPEVCNLCRM